jgi:BRCA1-associated protein
MASVNQSASCDEPHNNNTSTTPPLSHARQHYDDTLHAYALDTETQHVWDFAGQGYVHRLLQNAKDDKLVEVNDPHNTSQERSLSPGLSDAQEEQVVHRKLEGFANQYYTLLKSQLEQQRIYYESRLEEIQREYGCGRKKKSGSASADLISALKQERNQLAQRNMTLRQRYEKVSGEIFFLRNMNESLEANKAPMKRQITEAQRQRAEARDMIRKCLPPLEEKVTILMLQLEESMNAIEQAPSVSEIKPAASR